MLNAASNTTAYQTYTFHTGAGATNFARLALLNGSLYRGGTVTIGTGGALVVSNGVAAITNLVLQSGGTFAVNLAGTNNHSQLVALGSVTLGGSALTVSLGEAPDRAGFEYVILRKDSLGPVDGSFAVGTVLATYAGREYPLSVRTAGGDGNDVSLVYRTQGTALFIE